MLIGPLWWLQQFANHDNKELRLAIITAFLVVFAVALAILTITKPLYVISSLWR
jgi:hypothetical protein